MSIKIPFLDTQIENHWNIPPLDTDSHGLENDQIKYPPTYLEFATKPLKRIEELALAADEKYPHFLAVLSPKRLFIHYLIAKLVCQIQIASTADLNHKLNWLHSEYSGLIVQEINGSREELLAKVNYARDYFSQRIKTPNPIVKKLHEPHLDGVHVINYNILDAKLEAIYKNIEKKVTENSKYTPGTIDKKIDTKEKAIIRLSFDEFLKKEYENIAKNAAQNAINHALSRKPKEYRALPKYYENDRLHFAVAGVIASGKNKFIESQPFIEKNGRIRKFNRRDFAYIDLDEYKQCTLIVKKEDDQKFPLSKTGEDAKYEVSWNSRSHDECHMIRRKILDELEEQGKKRGEKAPDVFIQTSLISKRLMGWLSDNQCQTDIHLFYCPLETALKNSYLRQKSNTNDNRRMSSYVVLKSFDNLISTLNSLLERPSNLSQGTANKGPRVTLYNSEVLHSKKSKNYIHSVVMQMQPDYTINMLDLKAFLDIQKYQNIEPKATQQNKALSGPKPIGLGVFLAIPECRMRGGFVERLNVKDPLKYMTPEQCVQTLLRSHPVAFYELEAAELKAYTRKIKNYSVEFKQEILPIRTFSLATQIPQGPIPVEAFLETGDLVAYKDSPETRQEKQASICITNKASENFRDLLKSIYPSKFRGL